MGIEGSAVAWKPQPALHLTVRERLHNRRDAGGGGTGRVGRGGARPGPPFPISLLTTSDNVQAVRPPRPLASSPPPPASLGVVQTFPIDDGPPGHTSNCAAGRAAAPAPRMRRGQHSSPAPLGRSPHPEHLVPAP